MRESTTATAERERKEEPKAAIKEREQRAASQVVVARAGERAELMQQNAVVALARWCSLETDADVS